MASNVIIVESVRAASKSQDHIQDFDSQFVIGAIEDFENEGQRWKCGGRDKRVLMAKAAP